MIDELVYYHKIVEGSLTDGPGPRAVLFMQGCTVRCPGCQNRHLWERTGATIESPHRVAQRLLETGQDITISGGEPTDQGFALFALIGELIRSPHKMHITIYTGRTLEALLADRSMNARWALAALLLADVIVDGQFEPGRDDDWLQWRGSRNQRPIDVKESLWAMFRDGGRLENLSAYIVLDPRWDRLTLAITATGMLGPKGLIEQLTQEEVNVQSINSPRCGSAIRE